MDLPDLMTVMGLCEVRAAFFLSCFSFLSVWMGFPSNAVTFVMESVNMSIKRSVWYSQQINHRVQDKEKKGLVPERT